MILTVAMFVVMLLSLGFIAKQVDDCMGLLAKYRILVQEQRMVIDEMIGMALKAITPSKPVPPAEEGAKPKKKRGRHPGTYEY